MKVKKVKVKSLSRPLSDPTTVNGSFSRFSRQKSNGAGCHLQGPFTTNEWVHHFPVSLPLYTLQLNDQYRSFYLLVPLQGFPTDQRLQHATPASFRVPLPTIASTAQCSGLSSKSWDWRPESFSHLLLPPKMLASSTAHIKPLCFCHLLQVFLWQRTWQCSRCAFLVLRRQKVYEVEVCL